MEIRRDNERIIEIDAMGNINRHTVTSRMISPVICNLCGKTYDLCDGEPIHRYADCTVYRTPCCGKVVDDRSDGWTATPAFRRINN